MPRVTELSSTKPAIQSIVNTLDDKSAAIPPRETARAIPQYSVPYALPIKPIAAAAGISRGGMNAPPRTESTPAASANSIFLKMFEFDLSKTTNSFFEIEAMHRCRRKERAGTLPQLYYNAFRRIRQAVKMIP